MSKFVLATRRFLRDEEGVTAIEYGLIAALIAVAIIAGAAIARHETECSVYQYRRRDLTNFVNQ